MAPPTVAARKTARPEPETWVRKACDSEGQGPTEATADGGCGVRSRGGFMRWARTGKRGIGKAELVGAGPRRWGALAGLWLLCFVGGGVNRAVAQENPLGEVHTNVPAPTPPKDTRPVITGDDVARKAANSPGSAIRVNVNLVLVPMSVTDPMNRLVTGLERENFQVFDNNMP